MENPYNVDNISINYNQIIWIISSIICFCFILIFFGYYIGKYLNQTRKKRANELVDDFDYIENNNDEKNNCKNNLLVDEEKNIN